MKKRVRYFLFRLMMIHCALSKNVGFLILMKVSLWVVVVVVLFVLKPLLLLLLQIWNSPRREQRSQKGIGEYFQLAEPTLRHSVGISRDMRRSSVALTTSVPDVISIVIVVIPFVSRVVVVVVVVVVVRSSVCPTSLLRFVFGR